LALFCSPLVDGLDPDCFLSSFAFRCSTPPVVLVNSSNENCPRQSRTLRAPDHFDFAPILSPGWRHPALPVLFLFRGDFLGRPDIRRIREKVGGPLPSTHFSFLWCLFIPETSRLVLPKFFSDLGVILLRGLVTRSWIQAVNLDFNVNLVFMPVSFFLFLLAGGLSRSNDSGRNYFDLLGTCRAAPPQAVSASFLCSFSFVPQPSNSCGIFLEDFRPPHLGFNVRDFSLR